MAKGRASEAMGAAAFCGTMQLTTTSFGSLNPPVKPRLLFPSTALAKVSKSNPCFSHQYTTSVDLSKFSSIGN
jgi:hypothetical protein